VVAEEEFERGLARGVDLGRVGGDDHAIAHGHAAGGLEALVPLDAHRAQEARGAVRDAGLEAERGDVAPGGAGGFEDGLARLGADGTTVEGEHEGGGKGVGHGVRGDGALGCCGS
jgi:hypothetical protein